MEHSELRHRYFELIADLVHTYLKRAELWRRTETERVSAMVGQQEGTAQVIEMLTRRIDGQKAEMDRLCEQAGALGARFELEEIAEQYGLSEVEREILLVLDTVPNKPGEGSGMKGAELLRLFHRHESEILEARSLLYSDAPLRANKLIVVDEYADSVLHSTFRLPEETIRMLLEHDAKEG